MAKSAKIWAFNVSFCAAFLAAGETMRRIAKAAGLNEDQAWLALVPEFSPEETAK